MNRNILPEKLVFCTQVPSRDYAVISGVRFPELPDWARATAALAGFRSLLRDAQLDREHFNSPEWNPLEELLQDKRVVLKPNWVFHENGSGAGLDCLITHPSIIEAVLHYVILARPKSIIIGDAPIQGCDFGKLMADSGTGQMIEWLRAHDVDVQVKDFRRTIRSDTSLATKPAEECRPLDQFILYDLAEDSALEEITGPDTEFRVTMYNPDLLKRTHTQGKHQYLIARDAIEADVVLNLPKLKTHKKACITGALKNLVGINGHKEYLPHHRKGDPSNGGDCYPQRSHIKALIEELSDATNRSQGSVARWLLANAVRAGSGFGRLANVDDNYEGSWHGNDTVWRMTLDLQRILRYGREDGTLAESPQRTVLTITDAIIAGEGEGPLAPTPIDLGVITLSANAAAAEWIHSILMGLSPERIPLTRGAFRQHRYSLADFSSNEISVVVNGQSVDKDHLLPRYGRSFRLPKGWQPTVAPSEDAEEAI